MEKSPLIWISVVVACVIVLASFTNVVGIQTVESSEKNVITDEVNQKELLFQTILDLANNKEIQKLLLNSELRGGTDRSLFTGMRLSVFTSHVLTKKYLNHAYNIGLILSKTLSPSKIRLILERYQLSNQGMRKKIAAVIEKNDELNKKIEQLSTSNCDCENDNTIRRSFPVLCLLLVPLVILSWYLSLGDFAFLGQIVYNIGSVLNCSWY